MQKLNSLPQKNLIFSLLFFIISILFPIITESTTFDIIVKIRFAIHSGDSGGLIVAAMISCILFTVPTMSLYLSLEYLGSIFKDQLKLTDFKYNILLFIIFVILRWVLTQFYTVPQEPLSSFLGLAVTLILVYFSKHEQKAMMPKFIIAFQVFFFVQWLNVMPLFSIFNFGTSDISISIKIASIYLENTSVVNSIGVSFIIPFMLSSIMTSMNFRLNIQNSKIIEENYQRTLALEVMQNKIMDNRIYQEINTLAHDLKTPLATIRGLTSLLALNKDLNKLESYANRVDQAVVKMTDMISSFLYGTSRESIEVNSLIDYIRAQLPVENDNINFFTEVDPNLPNLYVNKVRIARALVNIIENAILAPHTQTVKEIKLKVTCKDDNILIDISDNGVGIVEEELENIWLIGYSSKNTTGLGLPFAKQTILENDGLITLYSQFGIGTRVSISLPTQNKGVTYDEK